MSGGSKTVMQLENQFMEDMLPSAISSNGHSWVVHVLLCDKQALKNSHWLFFYQICMWLKSYQVSKTSSSYARVCKWWGFYAIISYHVLPERNIGKCRFLQEKRSMILPQFQMNSICSFDSWKHMGWYDHGYNQWLLLTKEAQEI